VAIHQLPLSDAIKQALLYRRGNLGKVLRLVVAFEQAAQGTASDRTLIRLNHYYLDSRSWASAVLTGLQES